MSTSGAAFRQYEAKEVTVVAWTTKRFREEVVYDSQATFFAQSVHPHPDFNQQQENMDIGIIIVKGTFQDVSSNFKPAQLAHATGDSYGSPCYVLGLGHANRRDSSYLQRICVDCICGWSSMLLLHKSVT